VLGIYNFFNFRELIELMILAKKQKNLVLHNGYKLFVQNRNYFNNSKF